MGKMIGVVKSGEPYKAIIPSTYIVSGRTFAVRGHRREQNHGLCDATVKRMDFGGGLPLKL